MTIYGEYLFLENALVGWLLLHLTGRLCGVHPAGHRIFFGSLLCGFSAFLLFLPYQPLWLLACFRLAFPLGLVLLVFGKGKGTIPQLGRTLLLFYLLSLAAGGIAIGFMYFTGTPGVTGGGFFYIGKVSYLQVGLGLACAWLGLSALVRILRDRLRQQRVTASVRIVVGERILCADGLMDTGNFLRDPVSGAPVILASEKIFQQLWPKGIPPSRFRLIPFRSVGAREGFLKGALPDAVFWEKDPPVKLKKGIVIALCDTELSPEKAGGCALILHPDMEEGEMVCHV